MSAAVYGCMAEFASAEQLVGAVLRVRHLGYARVEAYAPFAVPGLSEALGPMRDRVPLATLFGGLLGGLGTLAVEYWSAVVDYPIDVGGRPDASWPAFIPAALEMCILFAVLFGVAAMLWSNRLPRLYHPVFNVGRFGDASRDGFFLVIRADDPQYDEAGVRHCLDELAPLLVEQVAA
ncbi:MAG TPA: DUF3341 domain-containing protein [Rhodanobacteraceae bacterium]|nr:DUF3341 domain-containing protein [Rhodanobacteraceae bacterium]